MSTSKKTPGTAAAPNPYARFIPREELGSFAAWNPQSLEPVPVQQGAGEAGAAQGRRPSFAERAAAEPHPFNKSAGGARAAGPSQAGAQARVAPARRPVVGGVPGQEGHEAPPSHHEALPELAPSVDELTQQARKDGYQEGYRNGLAALESYKQAQAAQMAAYLHDHVGALAADFHRRLDSLEQQLAGRIAGVALELSRQVVRTELEQRPETVLTVAEEALGALLATARQIVLRLHPEDHAMAQVALSETLQARGARLLPDSTVTRGGCLVESDIAVVDARVEARWRSAASAMGSPSPWNGGYEEPFRPVVVEADADAAVDDLLNGDSA